MKGKERCKALKEIRRQIAENNDIEYVVSECTFQGECKGVCPKCEAELKYLERELERRRKLGKTIAIAGIAASVCTGLTACSPKDVTDLFNRKPAMEQVAGEIAEYKPEPEDLGGDVDIVPEVVGSSSTDAGTGSECNPAEGSEADPACTPTESIAADPGAFALPEDYEGGLEMLPEDWEDGSENAGAESGTIEKESAGEDIYELAGDVSIIEE